MSKKIYRTLLTAVLFFVITMPFREFFKVMEVTEMRPASALPPAFGLMFGLPGALGCAIGNLAADILSGYSPVLCVLGFMAQFIYGLFPLIAWNFIKSRDKSESEFFRLNNVKNVMRYITIVLTDSMLMAVILGVILQCFHFSPFFSTATLMLFLNNFVFCMVLGIPIIILMAMKNLKDANTGISLNERFVLIFLLLGVISAGLIGVFAYTELSHTISDPLAMWNRIYLYIAADIFVINLITVLFLRYAERNITIPIETIAHIAKNYIGGEKGKKDSASTAAQCEKLCVIRNETGTLAEAFRTMILDLDTYIDNLTAVTAEKERIATELGVATQIQASMLPCIFPPFPDRKEFEIYASMLPAKEVGGDFYDFFFADENNLAVVIADVSGKGVPAALFMVIAKTLIKNNACSGKSPKEVFETVNNMLCENNDAGMFVTAFMGYFDMRSRRFTYVNAGHNAPLIKKVGGEYEFLKTKPCFILAGFEDVQYKEENITLEPGDTLYLYTDGVTEAMNRNMDLFTDPRLITAANNYKERSVKDLLAGIKEEIDLFASGAEQADDITMLGLRINL